MSAKVINIQGQVFGEWKVISPWVNNRWFCRCSCGVEKWVASGSLHTGRSKSCGNGTHYSGETAANYRHGMVGTPVYRSWAAMKFRVLNPNSSRYHSHGGRGIKICDEWLEFENFYADMGDRPEGTSLDRIDNDGDYTPENCRWATPIEQASNTKQSHQYTYNGITDTQAGWARRVGITPATLCKRLKRGWSLGRALGFV